MRIVFSRSKSFLSWVIRTITRSPWSHCGILTDSGTVIEAAWPKVREVPLALALADTSVHAVVTFPCHNPQAMLAFARAQIGKAYDWRGILGFFLDRDWRDEDCWWCSELVEAAFEDAMTPHFRQDAIQWVPPQALWLLEPRVLV